ncbi:squalene/phytoene synthase family protein [Arcanobacterium phocisimile]|uniref:Squalene/phytoene synthase family protein n=1 Tax=Arcanobacterium phocisimile TaxID=1302235 RepID=A0ABX7IH16_9ACTO|nr:squalene/phytoene synthase family protein [Arcanobacterium phocisimile]QRV01754.1 squalene/phytoene synthase family protein [Arcanobacterium phocisimile]
MRTFSYDNLGTSPANYLRAAHRAANQVITQYSTSFGLAVTLLKEPVRTDVRNIYAMVRVADEIVDGACAGIPHSQIAQILDDYEARVFTACELGFSSDLILHAFAETANRCRIDHESITAFFNSMRSDLTVDQHDGDSLETYVYGSAEVVGLMCLRTFLASVPDPEAAWAELSPGAKRLGAAFQKVNFLRDIAADSGDLGRTYFPGVTPQTLDEKTKIRLVDEIDADLAAAADVIPRLPDSSRLAVRLVHDLFAELNRRIRLTPASRLAHTRVRVPNQYKAWLLTQASATEFSPQFTQDLFRRMRAGQDA